MVTVLSPTVAHDVDDFMRATIRDDTIIDGIGIE